MKERELREFLTETEMSPLMNKLTASYREELIRDLADPAEAASYLNAALEDGSQEIFLMALRDIAGAKGMTTLSKKAKLNRESLYRMLSNKGNPQLSSLTTLLECAGLRLVVEVRQQPNKNKVASAKCIAPALKPILLLSWS